MIKLDIINEVVNRTGITKTKAEMAVETVFETMKKALEQGDRIELRGFGVFNVKPRKTGIGRNPRTGAEVSIPFEERAALSDDEVYQSDMIGCEVVDAGGRPIGVVIDFQETGGTPLLEVKTTEGRELLIPFANSICTKIDLENKLIVVDPPEGLLDLN